MDVTELGIVILVSLLLAKAFLLIVVTEFEMAKLVS
jgi:hypothetical protein